MSKINKKAVFLGRYQPPSIAHAATVCTILQQWDKCIIAIVSAQGIPNRIDTRWYKYINESKRSFVLQKNPFIPEECQKMWQAFINSMDLGFRVEAKLAPRPFDPNFNNIFPIDHTNLVYPIPNDLDPLWDRQRYRVLKELLARPILFVDPPLRIHNAEIRKKIYHEGRNWSEFLAAGAYEVFVDIDGPRRMAKIDLAI